MKQLILIGGMPWKADSDSNALSFALRTHIKPELNIAFCNFARNHDNPHDKDDAMNAMFNKFGGNKKMSYLIMTSENFREVSEWADVIYMPGGDPALLVAELQRHADIEKLWDNKIISGSSAGADIMCTYYVYLQDKTFGKGFGWVQATLIPHWGHYEGYSENDWKSLREEALNQTPDLPVLCIPEGQFVEITVQ